MLQIPSDGLSIAADGSLCFAGYRLLDLAVQYGTPLYLLDEERIRANCREYRAGFADYPDFQVIYASKALMNQAVCRLMKQEGLGLDVISGGELYTALSADVPAELIWFHGNNKSADELEMALRAGVSHVVIDNVEEILLLQKIAQKLDIQASAVLRATPGIEAHTHQYIQTGQWDTKFGIAIRNGELLEAAALLLRQSHLRLLGLHCHIGSQIMELAPFCLAAEMMMEQLAAIRDRFGLVLPELNLGGGFGIRYLTEEVPLAPQEVVAALTKVVREQAAKRNLPLPKLFIEPGRSLVGSAGATLYRIGFAKDIHGIRRYLTVDGGMSDNPRPALYQARYEAISVEHPLAESTQIVHLAGKHCESGDILIRDLPLPEVQQGEHLLVLATGAYNYSMASNYNRLPRPAMLLLGKEGVNIIVQRESYQQLIANDCIPSHLR